jgi:hypothetical protein
MLPESSNIPIQSNAWEKFGNCPTVGQWTLDAKALYLLAAPSTPEEARAEALDAAGGSSGPGRAHLSRPCTCDYYRILPDFFPERAEQGKMPSPKPGIYRVGLSVFATVVALLQRRNGCRKM